MWTIILIIIGLLAFGFIRGSILKSRTYKVVNKKGLTFHMGSYSECCDMAKSQNNFCKTHSIDDYFKVVRYKF